MRHEPTLLVSCDAEGCDDEVEVTLTATARGYDERGVDRQLKSFGWRVTDDGDFCEDCARKCEK